MEFCIERELTSLESNETVSAGMEESQWRVESVPGETQIAAADTNTKAVAKEPGKESSRGKTA